MRATEFLQEEVLDEVAMNPASLRKMAAGTGAKAGIEFEMVVPNVNYSDDEEMEPDFDSDERVTDFSSIHDFFYEGDFNSLRDINAFIDSLREGYFEWASEQRWEQWADEGFRFFKDYYRDNEFVEDGAREEAENDVRESEPDVPDDSDEFQDLVRDRMDQILEQQAEEAWDDQGRAYDNAHEEWEENADWPEESDYLRYAGYRYMSDLPYSENGVTWPYWTSSGGDSGANIQAVADDFTRAIGRPVNASTSYHGGRRAENTYVIEPDSSIDPADNADSGLEFVSPPLPIDEMLSDFNKVIMWAKKSGCYTNNSTGLHMNVSVPKSANRENIDYIKLALLLGDNYVLEQFGRAANTYTKSALSVVLQKIKQNPSSAQQLLQQMKSGLDAQASKIVHNGITDKYVSINAHDGYIEFRSPGGDWLNADWPKLENTLLRFVVALDAATDPQKFRKEYLKKLYQILQPKSEADPITMFAKFSANELSKQELVQRLKQVHLKRNIEKSPNANQKYWWRVYKDGQDAKNSAVLEVVAFSAEQALAMASNEWNIPVHRLGGADVVPVKPYIEPNTPKEPSQSQAEPGRWGRWIVYDGRGNRLGFISGRDAASAKRAAEDSFPPGTLPPGTELRVEPESADRVVSRDPNAGWY